MDEESDLVYPVTAYTTFAGERIEVVSFESVAAWQDHIERKIDKASTTQKVSIVPRNENKTHGDMFNGFAIEFKYEKSGKSYGSVISQMRMPIPAKTMVQ